MRPEVVKDAIKALREQQRGGDGLARYLKRKGQKPNVLRTILVGAKVTGAAWYAYYHSKQSPLTKVNKSGETTGSDIFQRGPMLLARWVT